MELSALTVLILVVVSPVAAQEEQAIHGFPDGATTPQIAGLSHNDLSNVNAELDADLAEDEILPCKLSPCLPVCNDIVKNTTAGPVTNLVCAPALACLNANSKCLEMLRTQQQTAQNELTKALKIGSKKEAYPSPDYPLTSADATAGTKSGNAGASKGASFKRGRRTQGNCALDGKCAHAGMMSLAWAKVCPAGQYCRGGGTFGRGLFHCTARPGGHTNAFFIRDSNLKSGKYDNNYGGACNPTRFSKPILGQSARAGGAASASGKEHFKLESEEKNGVKLPKFKRVQDKQCRKSFEVDMTAPKWANLLKEYGLKEYTEESICCGCEDIHLLEDAIDEIAKASKALTSGGGLSVKQCAPYIDKCLAMKAQGRTIKPGREVCDAECNCQVGCTAGRDCRWNCGTKKSFLDEEEKAKDTSLKEQLGKMRNCIAGQLAKCTGKPIENFLPTPSPTRECKDTKSSCSGMDKNNCAKFAWVARDCAKLCNTCGTNSVKMHRDQTPFKTLRNVFKGWGNQDELADEHTDVQGDLDDINLQLEMGGGMAKWGMPKMPQWGPKKEPNTPTPTDAPENQHSGASNARLEACRLF